LSLHGDRSFGRASVKIQESKGFLQNTQSRRSERVSLLSSAAKNALSQKPKWLTIELTDEHKIDD
jgi:hypothetical protein